jgi:amino acid transporter
MIQNQLKRKLNKINLLFISFAAIFGSGWLFAPFYAAQIAGPASLLAWALGALISIVIGITMAEVITLFPETGGLNSIARVTHGELLSLMVTVFNLLVFVMLPAIEVRAVLQYSSSYFKFLINSDNGFSALGYAFAIILLTGVTLVNLYGARLMTLLTHLTVGFKVLTPILLCSSFLYVLLSSQNLNHANFSGFFPVHWEQIFQAIATSGIIFSFNGFNQATVFAGEAKNPSKAIPFAIIGSILFSGTLYCLIQYVFIVSVQQDSLARGWGHLSFVGDQGPFAGMAVLLGLHWLVMVIYADAVVSPLGTAFNYASAAPRLFYVLSENNKIFSKLRILNQHGVPYVSIAITLVLEIAAFFLLPSLKAMISILVAAFVLCYTVAPVSLLKLRRTHPELHRPFRVKYAPYLCFLSLLFSNLMVFSCGWIAIRNLIFVAGILLAFYLGLNRNRMNSFIELLRGCGWFLFQLIAIVVLVCLYEFYQVPFSISAIGIAVVSIISLYIGAARSDYQTI